MKELEADKIINTTHPRITRKLYGHEPTKNTFLESLKKDKLHHAWLIHGPKGVGKATLAWKIVKLLQNDYQNFDELEDNNTITTISRRIEALSEQSVLLCRRKFDETKKKFLQEISVDEIRKINHFFSLSSTELKYRIVIIDTINELSISGSNALLKILEEPPKNGIFILICDNKHSILPTIISRCRILECNSLLFQDFQKALLSSCNKKMEIEKLEKLYFISRGSIDKAIELEFHNGLEIFENLIEILLFFNGNDKEKIWKLISQKHSFDTTKEYHKFLIILLLSAITHIGNSLATNKNSPLISKSKLVKNDPEKKDEENYFPYSLIYSIILEDLNNALKVNLNLADTLLSSFIKIEKINNSFK